MKIVYMHVNASWMRTCMSDEMHTYDTYEAVISIDYNYTISNLKCFTILTTSNPKYLAPLIIGAPHLRTGVK